MLRLTRPGLLAFIQTTHQFPEIVKAIGSLKVFRGDEPNIVGALVIVCAWNPQNAAEISG